MSKVESPAQGGGYSRRAFLKGSSAAAAATALATGQGLAAEETKVDPGQRPDDDHARRQRPEAEGRSRAPHDAARSPSLPLATDRRQADQHRRLERRQHGARRRQAGQRQHRAGDGLRRQADPNRRKPGGRQARRRARGVRAPRRLAVRLLHAGLRDGGEGLLAKESQGHRGGDSRGPQRQPLPLRHLRQHHSGRPRRRERSWKWLNTPGPIRANTSVLGKEHDKIDAPAKCTGAAKYSYDINPPKMLFARVLGCPHAHCKIKSIDLSAAEKVPGVVAVRPMKKVGRRNPVAGRPDGRAWLAKPKAPWPRGWRRSRSNTKCSTCSSTKRTWRPPKQPIAPPRAAARRCWKKSPAKTKTRRTSRKRKSSGCSRKRPSWSKRHYGISAITHMCLEPHGSTCDWKDDKLVAHLSTQNVSGTAGQFAAPLGITADDVTIHCDYIGGGFGSKFAADPWDVLAAQTLQGTGPPGEADARPRLGAEERRLPPLGFCRRQDRRRQRRRGHRLGFAPLVDRRIRRLGRAAGRDALCVRAAQQSPPRHQRKDQHRRRNGPGGRRTIRKAARCRRRPSTTSPPSSASTATTSSCETWPTCPRSVPGVYAEEMEIAAKLMDWKAKWHRTARGRKQGSIVTGLGMAMHTWGGGGHGSTCLVKIHPDGGVETFLGSQDLGTGTRTVIAMVLAETFGLPVSAVKVNIGSSKYPASAAPRAAARRSVACRESSPATRTRRLGDC